MRWPYEKIGVTTTRAFRNLLNKIIGDIGADMQEHKDRADNIQAQVDNLVADGDSSPEAAQARVGADGTNYTTLKQRLDTEHADVTAQLAEKANQSVIDNAILTQKEVYVARHKSIRTKIVMKQPSIKGYIMGDSIGAGDGASEYGKNWFYLLGKKIRDAANFGSPITGYNPLSVAVGSQDIRSVMVNIGLQTDKDLTSKSLVTPFNYDYWCICTGRNDAENNRVDIKTFETLYRLAVQMGLRNGIDVFCLTEQPKIDMVTGKVLESEKDYYNLYADVIRRVALEEGASLVDVNKHWYNLLEQGIDLRTYTADGTHPNDAGQAEIATLCINCILATPTIIRENQSKNGKVVKTFLEPSSAYNVASVTGLGNVRNTYLGLDNSILLNDGESIDFDIGDIVTEYLFVAGLMKVSTGTITVQSPSGYNVIANQSFGNDLGTNAQTSKIFALSSQANMITRTVKIIASGGPVYITGIGIIGNQKISEHTEVNGVFAGTWNRTSVAPGMYVYKTNTLDDTIEIDWIGEEINIEFCLNPNGGDAEITTDGLYTSTINMYATYNGYFFRNPHRNQKLKNTRHKTIIKAKTDSGGRTGVYLRGVRIFAPYDKGYLIPLKDRIKGFITQPYKAVKDATITNNEITSATDVLAEIISLD